MTTYDEACAAYDEAQLQTNRVVQDLLRVNGEDFDFETHLAYVIAGQVEDEAFQAWREAFKINWAEALNDHCK